MDNSKRIKKNALISIVQIIISSLSLFFIYKLVLNKLGLEQLGLWSVVSAIVGSARIGQLGLSGAVVKHVSTDLALNKPREARNIVETAFYTTLLSMVILLLVIYPALTWFIRSSIPEPNLADALSLIPYVSVYLLTITLSGVFLAGLDGCHRFDIKGYIVISGNLLLLLLTYLFIDELGIKGLIVAQIIQATILNILGWLYLKKVLSIKHFIPSHWNKQTFKKIWKYGINFQIISITQMLYDPTTKMLLSYFGGLELTGIYEMANRLVTQARAIPTTANQVLVPYISEQHTLKKDDNVALYKFTCSLMFYLSTLYYAILILALPIVSWLWFGLYNNNFYIFTFILISGYWVNTLSAPAYFSFLGAGYLKWVVISHIIIAITNLIIGYLAGKYIPNYGVAIGWAIALILGSLLTIIMYHHDNKITISAIHVGKKLALASLIITFLIISYWLIFNIRIELPIYGISLIFMLILLFIFLPFFRFIGQLKK